jgi:hypothetical protein
MLADAPTLTPTAASVQRIGRCRGWPTSSSSSPRATDPSVGRARSPPRPRRTRRVPPVLPALCRASLHAPVKPSILTVLAVLLRARHSGRGATPCPPTGRSGRIHLAEPVRLDEVSIATPAGRLPPCCSGCACGPVEAALALDGGSGGGARRRHLALPSLGRARGQWFDVRRRTGRARVDGAVSACVGALGRPAMTSGRRRRSPCGAAGDGPGARVRTSSAGTATGALGTRVRVRGGRGGAIAPQPPIST